MKIIPFLKKPHPFVFNQYSILTPGLITFFVIFFFQPFHFKSYSITILTAVALCFGTGVSSTVWIVVNVLKRFIPSQFDEDKWTIGKEVSLILFVLSSITSLVFLVFWSLQATSIDSWLLFKIIFIRTVLIAFFPILVMVLFEQYYLQKKKWQEAQKLNLQLEEKQQFLQQEIQKVSQSNSTSVSLQAENGNVNLQLKPQDILYLKSEGNYVEVFYLQAEKVQKELIRNRLKILEDKLPTPDFFRCHKSFVVNLHQILKVDGNARNLELILQHHNTNRIPVSRNKSEGLAELLKNIQ